MCREDPPGLRIRTLHSKRQTFPEPMPQTVEWFDHYLKNEPLSRRRGEPSVRRYSRGCRSAGESGFR